MRTVRDEPGFDFPDWWGTVFEWCTYVVVGGWFVAAIPYALGNQTLLTIVGIIIGIAFIVANVFIVLMKVHFHSITGRWRWPKKREESSPPLPPPPGEAADESAKPSPR